MIEPICQNLTLLDLRRAVETKVFVAVNVEELLEDVEYFCHLSEDQGSVAPGLQLPEKFVKSLQFAAVVLQKAFVGELDGQADPRFVPGV